MLSPDFLLTSIRGLLSACQSTLVVELVSPAYGGYSVSCDQVATQDDLFAICDEAIPIFPAGSCVTAILPTSMSYLKLVNIPYFSLVGERIQPERILEFIKRLLVAVRKTLKSKFLFFFIYFHPAQM